MPRLPESLRVAAEAAHPGLAAAELGYRVLPTYGGDRKHPAIGGWREEATSDPAVAHRWFVGEWPEGGYGVATDGLLVVDLDVAKQDGEPSGLSWERRADLEAAGGARVATPSGGEHWYFRQPPGARVPPSVGKVAAKVDIRADGTMVVGPGTRRGDGRAYEGTLPPLAELPVAPDWLVQAATAATGAARGDSRTPAARRAPGHLSGSRLAELLSAPPVGEGERNDWLTSVAGCLAARDRDEAGYLEQVRSHSERLAPPLGDDEVRQVAASVWGREQAKRAVPDGDDPTFDDEVARQVRRRRVQQAADDLLRDERAAAFEPPPDEGTLADQLAQPRPETPWLIGDLLRVDGVAGLIAQFKSGKTTTGAELAVACADERPFLGRFPTRLAEGGTVGIWNGEMVGRDNARWLADAGIERADRVHLLNLRGYSLPLDTEAGARWAVEWLERRRVDLWIVDTWARIVGMCGGSENDNDDALRITEALDEIKRRAGVRGLVVMAHTGRAEQEAGEERARGATRFDDWLDSRWLLTKDREGRRYLRAHGRDVDVAEFQVRKVGGQVLAAEGGRRQAAQEAAVEKVVAAVHETRGIGVTGLRRALGGNNEVCDRAVAKAIALGLVHRVMESRNKAAHYPGPDPQGQL